MGIVELVLIAVGLSMDAFAVSISKGLSTPKINLRNCLTVGMYFGIFQAGMPLIGYFLGSRFKTQIEQYDHWIALVLLVVIGGKMVYESFSKEETPTKKQVKSADKGPFSFPRMLPLAIATSIDALAVGVVFAINEVEIILAVLLIGAITFVLSAFGVKIGNVVGTKYKSKAEFAGGVTLVLIGFKILFEHLGVINF